MIQLPRLYPILDTGVLDQRRLPIVETARAMLNAGVEILQWRCKDFVSRRRVDEAEQIALLCRRFHVPLVVNDRADIALMLEAGLHLGQDDLPPAAARRLLPRSTIGYSTHNNRQIAAAFGEPVDYLAIGPVFGTATKANPDPVVGLDNLRAWRPLTARPLVAIGGITRTNAASLIHSGADSVAVIGDLYPPHGPVSAIEERVREWLALLE
jgi:thiamine-phosphate pyrophosphorylase